MRNLHDRVEINPLDGFMCTRPGRAKIHSWHSGLIEDGCIHPVAHASITGYRAHSLLQCAARTLRER